MAGPLAGITIVEIAGIGPAPFAAMMLADHGARVISIDRPNTEWTKNKVLGRSRESIVLNLKRPEAVEIVRRLIKSSDGIIEGFRPGVMERLGLGPAVLIGDNPRLVYGRMTGWGQSGPLSALAGHDINYIALSGALHAFGRAAHKPTPPANIVGDFGGGGMMLAFGMVSALLHARLSGAGQIIDCAMTEGSAVLMSLIWGQLAAGDWIDERGVNRLDTGAHYYDTYETRDGKYLSVGSIEPQFYQALRQRLGVGDDSDFDAQENRTAWPLLRQKMTSIFKSRTQVEWVSLFKDTDACVTPVLSMTEAPNHPHNRDRGAFLTIEGVTQPAPSPRYSTTQTDLPRAPQKPGADAGNILTSIGYGEAAIEDMRSLGVFG